MTNTYSIKNITTQYEKMTLTPVGSLLIELSIPTICSMLVTNIYNLVDTGFVGTLGTSESAATGIVFGFMAILQAIAFMCGQGAGSIMSRKLGAKDIDEATKYASTGFFLSFFIGVIISVFSFIFLGPLVNLLGSTPTIAPYAKQYIFYLLISAPFFTSSLTMNNLLRYEGKASLGTIGMITGSILNIGGDALFIIVFKMGISGAGLSTAISQFISFCILFSMFLFKKTQTSIKLAFITKNIKDIFNIISTGFPSLLRQGLQVVSTTLLNQSAGVYGDEAVAAMSIVSRISFFLTSFAIGIGQGFQPISSYNYGAKKYSRIKKAFWTAIIAEEVLLVIMSIPIIGFPSSIIRLLRDDNAVIAIATRALRLMCVSQIFVPLSMMVEMGFQSTGQKLLASFSSSLRSGLLLIPSLLLLSKYRGLYGIQEAQPLAISVTFLISAVLCHTYLNMLNKNEEHI